jgi:Mce-associated membrane protein
MSNNDEKVDDITTTPAESEVVEIDESNAEEIDASGAEDFDASNAEEFDASGAEEPVAEEPAAPAGPKRRIDWSRVLAYGVLPGLVLILAMAAGYLKWQDTSVRDDDVARIESIQAAKDSTVALLSYKADTVEQQLTVARDLLTGDFRDAYTSLTKDVVIPGAKEKQISATATVPAAASVSADPSHAVVLLFVNQTVVMGTGAPTDTASSVRVTMDKVDGRWLIAKFDPV